MRVPGTIEILYSPEGEAGAAPGGASAGTDSPASVSPSGSDSGSTSGTSESAPDVGTGAASDSPPQSQIDFDFGNMFGDLDLGVPPAQPRPKGPEPTAPQVPPAVPPVAAEAPKQVQPAGQAPSPGPGSTGSAEAAPLSGLDPYDPGALAYALRANEGAAVEQLAATAFKLSPEEIEAIESDVVSAIPRMRARDYVRAQTTMLEQMARLVPVMVQRTVYASQQANSARDEFYKAWPDLDASKHAEVVNRVAYLYKQINPSATKAEMIREIGPLAMRAAGVQVKAAPQVRGNGTRPFVPAPSGPAVIPQQVEENPWDILGGVRDDS